MNEITTEEIDSVIQDLLDNKAGDFTDVYQLMNNYKSVETKVDAKEVLRRMVDNGLVVPHPGSKYKIKKGIDLEDKTLN